MPRGLIVGGGVVGLSLAYELAGTGWQVTLLDRNEPGREASWAGAGILPPANQATARHPLDELRGLSFALHAEWAERLRQATGVDTGYRRCGGIYLARTPGEAASLHGLASLLTEEQVSVERLSVESLTQLEPELAEPARRGDFSAAYRLPDECQLRNPWHLRALMAACQQRGVEIFAGVEATGFATRGGVVEGVRAADQVWLADRVCLTSGAWTQQLLSDCGVETGILPIRGQMLLLRCSRAPFTHILNDGPRYLVPRQDGRVLIGSTEEDVGFDKRTTPEAIAELHALALALVPSLADAVVEQSWAGLRPATYDGFPYLGPIPGLEHAFVAAGHFRSGLYLSPGTAVVMSALLRDETPPIDLSAFRVSRG